MTVTLTDHRTVVNQADAITNWTGTTTLFTTDPTPIESTGEVGATVGVAIFDAYVTITSDDFSDAVIYCWVFSRLALGNTTDANGGLMVTVGDTTNLGAWKVAGADRAAFRHDDGPVGWQCPALDTTSLPASPLSRAGSAASVNFAAVTRVGTTVNSLVAAPGMNPTYLVDIIRVLEVGLNNGCAMSVIGGTSGDPGTFAQIAAADRSTGDLQAHGLVRQLGAGAFGVQGPLRFGNAAGTDSSWFADTNVAVVFESRGFRTTLYKIFITDNGSGTTTFKLGTKVGTGSTATGQDGCSIIAPTGVGGSFDSGTDTDVTDVFIYGSTFSGLNNGIILGSGQEFIGCTVSGSGAMTFTGSTGATLVNTTVNTSTVAADASSLVWNINTDTSGKFDGMTFSKGTNAHHAIELGTSSPISVTFNDITFSGFNASNGQNDSTILVSRTTGTVTINISGGTTPSYKSAGAIVNVVASVSVSVTVVDVANDPIQNAQTAIYLSSDDSQVLNTDTNASGVASTSFSGSTPANIYYRVRKSSTGSTKYIPLSGTGTISATGFSVTVTLRVDINA